MLCCMYFKVSQTGVLTFYNGEIGSTRIAPEDVLLFSTIVGFGEDGFRGSFGNIRLFNAFASTRYDFNLHQESRSLM